MVETTRLDSSQWCHEVKTVCDRFRGEGRWANGLRRCLFTVPGTDETRQPVKVTM